jgi:glucokinase
MSEPVIGVNIEDSHISVGLVNIETRKVIPDSVQRKRVDPKGSADQIIAAWTKVLREVAGECNRIGIGLPGQCDYETGILQTIMNDTSRYSSLYHKNLKQIFSSALNTSTENVKLMNDAACFLQGEVFSGSGRGFSKSIGITLGVGLGSAIYANGVVTDANKHSSPFKGSTAESYISVKWILRRYNELSGSNATDLSDLRNVADSDSRVTQVFEEFANNLSEFLLSFIKETNPEVVVIGGFMELYNRYFFDSLTDKMTAMGVRIPVLRAVLGEQASIIGAASAWYDATPIHA